MGRAGARPAPRHAGPHRVGVRAVQRPRRAARQPRRGRAASACPAPTSTPFYELRPLPYAEAGYGYPESGQTVIDVTNGKIIRLLVDDEPFDVRYGDLRAARAHRSTCAPARCAARCAGARRPSGRSSVHSTRLVSFTQRSVAAIATRSTAIDGPARVVLQSELVANEELPAGGGRPARVGGPGRRRCEPVEHDAGGHAASSLMHRTRAQRDRRRGGDRSRGRGPRASPSGRATEAPARLGAGHRDSAALGPGQTLRLVKFIATAGRQLRSTPGPARPGRRPRLTGAPAQRVGGAARRPARLPRRLLGRRRRRGRGRRGAAAGGAVRALPRPAGGRARRASGRSRPRG